MRPSLLPPVRRAAVEQAWANLVGPGPLLSAAERHQVIRDARAAWAGAALPNPASGVRGEAAHWLAMDAEGLRAEYVEDFEARGLGRLRYLEIVGIVGRLANVDFYVRGLGATELPLPEPSTAAPNRHCRPGSCGDKHVGANDWSDLRTSCGRCVTGRRRSRAGHPRTHVHADVRHGRQRVQR